MKSNSAVRTTRVEHSRRFLIELDKAPGGNNLQYILKCPCIPFFGNQGLHNEIVLGSNGGHSGVIYERSLYSHMKGSCMLYSITMCSRVWTSASPHGQLIERCRKNLCLYSLIGACPVVMWVKQAHSELVNSMTGSYELFLVYVSLMTFAFHLWSSGNSGLFWGC